MLAVKHVCIRLSQQPGQSEQHVVGWRDDTEENAGCSGGMFGSSVSSLSFPFLTGSIIWPPTTSTTTSNSILLNNWTCTRQAEVEGKLERWRLSYLPKQKDYSIFTMIFHFPFVLMAYSIEAWFIKRLIFLGVFEPTQKKKSISFWKQLVYANACSILRITVHPPPEEQTSTNLGGQAVHSVQHTAVCLFISHYWTLCTGSPLLTLHSDPIT